MLLSFASGCFTQCCIYCNPGFTLNLLQSSRKLLHHSDLHPQRSVPLRGTDELQEPYADRAIKASDKYSSKSKTTNFVEVKPVKLLNFWFNASRYFHVFCNTMGEFTDCSEAIFVA
ncbi:hypothetical protein ATANTOWER_021314 [Ataeniobius toweri]|uniref:Uncharacterized protein n=1 Tax=Ataeniobius toweri TaxID=208326 RepID=A0ABU7BU01_9TELE|nr:hypothetical protein [Ataeniobius toweri]